MKHSLRFSLLSTGPSRWLLALALVLGGIAVGFVTRGRAADRPAAVSPAGPVLTGEAALGDWTTDKPGLRRHITARDLAPPYATQSVNNGPRVVPQPDGAWPQVPPGFRVDEFARGFQNCREIITAPNGDLFVAESGPGRIKVLRGVTREGKAATVEVYATGLEQPFGLAFYPPGPDPRYLYVGNTGSVVRFAYRNGDLKADAAPEMIVSNIPSGGRLTGGGHWTRDVRFSRDGKKMFVSVGSMSNVAQNAREEAAEKRRAVVLEFNPDGTGERIFASGIRNAVGLAVHPETGELWASVNERDGLGDHLVPDYVTHVQEGGFYGWPWYYIGANQDPRHAGRHPELARRVIVPDVLLQSHTASLAMTFYTGRQFPADYRNDAFAAQHGSWNRARRTGYKVVRVPLRNGRATGEYEDFLTGFVTPEGQVWGRPVGVTAARDGALIVTDDGSNRIWRVTYTGRAQVGALPAR